MFGLVFSELQRIRDYRDWAASDHGTYEKVILRLFEKGVMPDIDTREPWFSCASHTDADAKTALAAFEEALDGVVG